jgi:purine-nucleoside phosphorylase
MTLQSRIAEAVAYIQPKISEAPEFVIVLGSGLGGLAEMVETDCVIDYSSIPHFKTSGAPGHVGRLLFGRIAGHKLYCLPSVTA